MKKYKIGESERRTLSWWYNRKNKIDFNPPYQRKGGLWSQYDKAYLIDSIINGFDIPKLYLADFTWTESAALNPKRLMYAVIDGKQRLETIFEFFEDKIALNDDFVYFSVQNICASGMKYSDLQKTYPELAENFREFNLSVVTIVTEDEETINELFIRLNRSKPLTGAEIRNAMKGKIPSIIRSIAEHEFFVSYVVFSNNRGEDKNAAAKILMFEYKESMQDTKRKTIDGFTQQKDLDENKLELTVRKLKDILDSMCRIFLPKDPLLKTPGTIPLLYWFIKSIDENETYLLRAFLVWFENERRKSEAKDFVEYNIANRSTNDELSFKKRLEILNKLFADWKKKYQNKNI